MPHVQADLYNEDALRYNFTRLLRFFERVFNVPYPGALSDEGQEEIRTNPALAYALARQLEASPTMQQIRVRPRGFDARLLHLK